MTHRGRRWRLLLQARMSLQLFAIQLNYLNCPFSTRKARPQLLTFKSILTNSIPSESPAISGVAVNSFPLGHCPWGKISVSKPRLPVNREGSGGQGFLFHHSFPTTGVLGQNIDRYQYITWNNFLRSSSSVHRIPKVSLQPAVRAGNVKIQ